MLPDPDPRPLRRGFSRVTPERPCPVCGKADWCLVADDGGAAVCPRTPEGAAKDMGAAGFLHFLRNDPPPRSPRRRSASVALPSQEAVRDWGRFARDCAAAVKFDRLAGFARSLGMSADALQCLGVGWSREHRAWTFPMRDGAGRVVGVRLRTPDGRKLAVKGSREGIVPAGRPVARGNADARQPAAGC